MPTLTTSGACRQGDVTSHSVLCDDVGSGGARPGCHPVAVGRGGAMPGFGLAGVEMIATVRHRLQPREALLHSRRVGPFAQQQRQLDGLAALRFAERARAMMVG